MNNQFRISSLLAGRLTEHKLALSALLRLAGLPPGFFPTGKDLRHDRLQAEEVEPDVLADLGLPWILSIGRRSTDGQVTPLRLELTRLVQNRELLEAHFGCRVRFKAGRNALAFHNSDLDRPFVTHNEELLTAIGAQLESELQARNTSFDVVEQVKHTLKRSLAGKRPTLQHVAQEIGMSVRTLQRRLADADITFKSGDTQQPRTAIFRDQ